MKKIFAVLLVLIMVFGLVACGGGTTTTTPDVLVDETPNTPEAPSTPGDTPEAPEEIGEWEGDYETATVQDIIKYGVGSTRWDGSLPLVTDGYSLEIGLVTDYRVSDLYDNPLTHWVEENTGLKLEWHIAAGSGTDFATQMNLMITGGEDLPDIIRMNGFSEEIKSEFVRYGDLVNMAGYFMTDAYYFSQAMAENYPEPDQYERILNFALANSSDAESGYMYAFPVIYNQSSATVNTQILINQQWLDKVGKKAPETIEELYDVLVAFRDGDPNGNGKKDELPIMGMTNSIGRGVDNYIVNAFIQWSVTNRIQVEDGKVFTVYTEDEYREALKFMNKLVKEGLMSEMVVTAGTTDLTALYNPGDGVATVGIACGWINTEWLESSTIATQYVALAPLKDAGYGRGGYGIFNAANLNTSDLITYSCERPEIAFRLLDWMCCPEGYMRHRWGEKGVHWEWIEDTEFADKAKGTGHLGGDAKFVRTGDSASINCRWYAVMSFVAEDIYQYYLDPNDTSTFNWRLIQFSKNVEYQKAAGQPPESFDFWSFQGDEWEAYIEYDLDIYNFVNRASDEFIVGVRDPNSDADWQQFQQELENLHLQESWIETAQASYDRQQQGIY